MYKLFCYHINKGLKLIQVSSLYETYITTGKVNGVQFLESNLKISLNSFNLG